MGRNKIVRARPVSSQTHSFLKTKFSVAGVAHYATRSQGADRAFASMLFKKYLGSNTIDPNLVWSKLRKSLFNHYSKLMKLSSVDYFHPNASSLISSYSNMVKTFALW